MRKEVVNRFSHAGKQGVRVLIFEITALGEEYFGEAYAGVNDVVYVFAPLYYVLQEEFLKYISIRFLHYL